MATKRKSDNALPNLEKLYFGKDDAESDFARGGLLRQGFMRTRAYEEALAGAKTLIIGRKGSGKSAICLMLRNALSSESLCALVTPDEISADEIRRFQLPGIPQEQSKQLIWRYVFAVQVAKFILAAGQKVSDKTPELSGKLGAIRKFLLDNGEIEDLTFTERFWKVIERLKGAISVEAFSVKLKVDGQVQPPSAGAKAHDQLDFLEAQLNAVALAIGLSTEGQPFHVLVDQIEKVWSNDRESDSMVVGLMLAAKDLQRRFGFAVATVFLRTDIYERLQFQDRDKFRGDEFHIDWNEEHLLDLILTRAQASLGVAITAEDLWDRHFPVSVDSQDCQKFLISRTLMRPRDIIQLCNACRDTARNNRHSRIEESDVRKAMALYSNWKLSDLQNEWSVNYPFLADLFVLLSNASYMLTRANFESALEQVKGDLSVRYPSLGHAFSTDTFLSVLYTIGFLGVVRHGKTHYSYSENSERQIQANDVEFVLHPSFRNALQSTSAIKLSPFESQLDINRRGIHTRVVREARLGQFEQLRSPRSERGLQYLESSLYRLRVGVEKSALSDELRTEVVSNLSAMQAEIRQAVEYADPSVAREVAGRLYRHLSQIADRLNDGKWLLEDRDLRYIFQESVEELERFIDRGGPGEFSA
jgi:energy-coupling factor transporter ATP-binding protein EcfA2